MRARHRLSIVILSAFFLAVTLCGSWGSVPEPAQAAEGTEFAGTVLSVDVSSGKFAVKKDGGGSRFTFVANEKTHFDGGLKAVKDLQKDDHVTVWYLVQGPQYVALKVSLTK